MYVPIHHNTFYIIPKFLLLIPLATAHNPVGNTLQLAWCG